MEEKKKVLEFIAPEVKVVSVASQRVLCESEPEPKEEVRSLALDSYDKVYF